MTLKLNLDKLYTVLKAILIRILNCRDILTVKAVSHITRAYQKNVLQQYRVILTVKVLLPAVSQ